MKVYNFGELIRDNNVQPLEDTELSNIVYCLSGIDINIHPNGPWIAGGSILKTYMGQPLGDSDIDIFFSSCDQSIQTHECLKKNAKQTKNTSFSTTFEFLFEYKGVDQIRKIQLVHFNTKPKASELILDFDLDICQLAFDGKRIVTTDDAISNIDQMMMTPNLNAVWNAQYTFRRIVKYANRGFKMSDKDMDDFSNKYMIRGPKKVNTDSY